MRVRRLLVAKQSGIKGLEWRRERFLVKACTATEQYAADYHRWNNYRNYFDNLVLIIVVLIMVTGWRHSSTEQQQQQDYTPINLGECW
jgi:hypothetical protein